METVAGNPQTDKIIPAFLAVQSEVANVPKRAVNPHFKSKYATMDDIMEMLSPILKKNNIFLTNTSMINTSAENPVVTVITTATHSSGQIVSAQCDFIMAKMEPQQIGAAITYGRRYNVGCLFNIITEEDTDGEIERKKVTPVTNTSVAPTPAESTVSPANNPPSLGDCEPKLPYPLAKTRNAISVAQLKRLYAIARTKGWGHEALIVYLNLNYKSEDGKMLEHLYDLSKDQYGQFCGWIETHEPYSDEEMKYNTDFDPSQY